MRVLLVFASFLLLAGAGLAQPRAGVAAPVESTAVTQSYVSPPEGLPTTETGVPYEILTPGTGDRRPTEGDWIALRFGGWANTGQVLPSNFTQADPSVADLARALPAWKEALGLMLVGERRRFWLPASRTPMKGVETVLFELELVRIIDVPEAPKDLVAPADADSLESGARTLRLEEGDGVVRPNQESAPLIHYTGWTSDGVIFDSTVTRGRPTLMPMDRIMPAFADCLSQMVVGEKRRCWIPGGVAQGQWVGSPRGDLTFDVELLEIMSAKDGRIGVPK